MEKINKISSSKFDIFIPDTSTKMEIPYIGTVRAGFPSPADDFPYEKIDLNKLLIKHPQATFFARAKGESMNKDFQDDDLLIIDRSLDYKDGYIAFCYIDGEFTTKRISKKRNKCYLLPSNENFPIIEVKDSQELMIMGIVTTIIRNMK